VAEACKRKQHSRRQKNKIKKQIDTTERETIHDHKVSFPKINIQIELKNFKSESARKANNEPFSSAVCFPSVKEDMQFITAYFD